MSVSEQVNGPWTTIRSGTFTEDPRQHAGQYNPQTSETFYFEPIVAQYVKFICTSYYGAGCVLQYIGLSGQTREAKLGYNILRLYLNHTVFQLKLLYFTLQNCSSPFPNLLFHVLV